jgi:hypothetical protein
MNRRDLIKSLGATAVAAAVAGTAHPQSQTRKKIGSDFPAGGVRAITMWDFSWIERRWPGAGYEDWDRALDELVERGYNAVRIDANPHLVHHDPGKAYTLLPHWTVQDWGSPGLNTIQPPLAALVAFIETCAEREIKVGLSTWFRKDEDDIRMNISSPTDLGEVWLATLEGIHDAGLMDAILYVDLCNEWTGDLWCPFFVNDPPEAKWSGFHTKKSLTWMQKSIDVLRRRFPELPYTFSFTGEVTSESKFKADYAMLDFLEPHIWMVSGNGGEFYREVGYAYDRFDNTGYTNLQKNGERVYREREDHWRQLIIDQVRNAADWSEASGKALITTECWGVVDYKDWPLLEWDWVKEMCELGVSEAVKTGAWQAISTSNFCGPQFTGMWRDIDWHLRLTNAIRSSSPLRPLKTV